MLAKVGKNEDMITNVDVAPSRRVEKKIRENRL